MEAFFPSVFVLVLLSFQLYMIVLAKRFVNAVEWIARSLSRSFPERPGGSPLP